MTRLRQYDVDEQELMEAEQAILEEQAKRGPVDGCPSDIVLRRFAAGREDREQVREEILLHLSPCNPRVQFLRRLPRHNTVAPPQPPASLLPPPPPPPF